MDPFVIYVSGLPLLCVIICSLQPCAYLTSCLFVCANWAATCDFQQCGILKCVDSDEPAQPPWKLRNSKWCSVSSLTVIEYSSDKQRLWSDCTFVQADLRLCWSHIPHCRKFHVTAQFIVFLSLSHMVSWFRCGTWLYWFLIFAFFLHLNIIIKKGFPSYLPLVDIYRKWPLQQFGPVWVSRTLPHTENLRKEENNIYDDIDAVLTVEQK